MLLMKWRWTLALCAGMVPATYAAGRDGPPPKPVAAYVAVPNGHLALPSVAAGVPPREAGCVVIGHHVRGGQSIHPRVMKGAFTSGVDAQQQEAFSASAIEAAKSWRFLETPEDVLPKPGFSSRAVGFVPAGAAPGSRAVIGLEAQHDRVRDLCKLDDLAAWGEQNAVPVEVARQRNGDKILARTEHEPTSFWTSAAGGMVPPHYPRAAFVAGITGCVVLGFIVGEDGLVKDIRIMAAQYNTPPLKPVRDQLDGAAAYAASKWRFSPGPDNLGRLPEFMQIPVDFRMDSVRWRPKACSRVNLTRAIVDTP